MSILVAGEGTDEDLAKGGAARPVLAAREKRMDRKRTREVIGPSGTGKG